MLPELWVQRNDGNPTSRAAANNHFVLYQPAAIPT